MTAGEILAIVEPLPDDWVVHWGCVDSSIPKKVYMCPKQNIGLLKEWLNSEEPYQTPAQAHEGKPVIVKQWLIGRKAITFYLGFEDET